MFDQGYYEDFFLMYLFVKGSIKTEEMEPLLQSHYQRINNVICNKENTPSHIKNGYIKHEKGLISITEEGRQIVASKYQQKGNRLF